MSRTYAIPDIHGRLDLLEAAIAKIVGHSKGEYSTVVTLGDYVDRGPSSRQVIEHLMSWRSDTLRIVNLKGNHEAMMWETCSNLAELSWWIENGGDQTLMSYGQTWPDKPKSTHCASSASSMDSRISPSCMSIGTGYLFTPQSIRSILCTSRVSRPFFGSDIPMDLLWVTVRRHVVHGHHANPKAPIVTDGKTNLDGLAWMTGRLVVGVFDDDRPGGASEFLEIIGLPDRR